MGFRQAVSSAVRTVFGGFGSTGGRQGRRFERDLCAERQYDARQSEQASPAEQEVATGVIASSLGRDQTAAPKLMAAANSLIDRVAEASTTESRRRAFDSQDRDAERIGRERAKVDRDTVTLADQIDSTAPLVAPRLLLIAESLLLIIEGLFWYGVFAKNLEPNLSWADPKKSGAVLFAVFIPLTGVLAARFAGPAWQRLLRYPAKSGLRVNQWVHAMVGLVMVGLVAWATGGLVHWRYAGSHTLGELVIPAGYMTTLFVSVIVLDALFRGFCDSEQHRVNLARDAEVAANRAQSDQLGAAVIGANARWAHSWNKLRMTVDVCLDKVEQIVCVGEQILLKNRSVRDDVPFLTPPQSDGKSPDEGTGFSWHVDVALLGTELRAVKSALAVLTTYMPPSLVECDQVGGISERITALEQRFLESVPITMDPSQARTISVPTVPGSDPHEEPYEGPEWPDLAKTSNVSLLQMSSDTAPAVAEAGR